MTLSDGESVFSEASSIRSKIFTIATRSTVSSFAPHKNTRHRATRVPVLSTKKSIHLQCTPFLLSILCLFCFAANPSCCRLFHPSKTHCSLRRVTTTNPISHIFPLAITCSATCLVFSEKAISESQSELLTQRKSISRRRSTSPDTHLRAFHHKPCWIIRENQKT